MAASLFLKDHAALKSFAGEVARHPLSEGDASRFVVVCERKEDMLAVRAMLAHHVARARQSDSKILAGVTMYTLDSLAEMLMKALSLGQKSLSSEHVEAFRRPFLDVVTQEKLLRVLLLRLRFPASDALSTAKQILTLVDVAFPEGENLFGLLLETQRLEKGPQGKQRQLTEAAFKQILCAYQGARALLPQFSRLQTFVLDYLESDFRDHVLAAARGQQDSMPTPSGVGFGPSVNSSLSPNAAPSSVALPPKILRSHLLWFAAPEYGNPAISPLGYRPGNFQSALVDSFRDAIFFARKHLSNSSWTTWHARCFLSTAEKSETAALSHVEARILTPRRHLWKQAQLRLEQAPAAGELLLLADFPLDEQRAFDSLASGPQPLHEEVLEHFAKSVSAPPEQGPQSSRVHQHSQDEKHTEVNSGEAGLAWQAINRTLQEHWDDLAEGVSLLDLFASELPATARAYGLSYVGANDAEFLETWKSYCLGETVRVGEPHPLSALPRALSFFPNEQQPKRIVALGRPHAPRSPSFIVKILNDAMAALRAKGVVIELPATDESYRGFYLWLAQLGIPLEFWIAGLDEFEAFPEFLSHKKGVRVTTDTRAPEWVGKETLASLPSLVDENWPKRLTKANAPKDKHHNAAALASSTGLSITQFERYVDCPQKFYLVDILNLNETEEPFASPPPKETGIAVHRVAEQFVSLYKLVGSEAEVIAEKNALRIPYLQAVKSLLANPHFLVNAPAEEWLETLGTLSNKHIAAGERAVAQVFVADIVSTLFSPSYEGPSRLRRLLIEETTKRAFLRLVLTDLTRLIATPDLQPGGFPEVRVDLSLGGLTLRGRVDRVDFSPRGYHIIDYKTSKVRRTEGKLVLFPEDAKSDKVRLSVQGALYTLAWCRTHTEHPVADFTLYRLKNLDEDVDVFMSADFGKETATLQSALYARLEETYGAIAESLAAGRFPATPRAPSVCAHCPALHTCPTPRANETQRANAMQRPSSEGFL